MSMECKVNHSKEDTTVDDFKLRLILEKMHEIEQARARPKPGATPAERQRRRHNAGLKASATKGPEEESRAAQMAVWTAANGKDDKQNPHSRQNYYRPDHPLHPNSRTVRIALDKAKFANVLSALKL